ncbi:hypothetical protein A3I57_03555 [Candidatus Beckwithbacteria bacterium RIFCSPLOWO2_02_FULL_47_23]|uniref:Glycosyl transferase family 1 domain-containing protein n=2 Tax=Candidatus Beckwithiibacteriota TaxID=1752726 RepID=A0A1F5E378_9BACT|nr:MAG: hypothetical protein A3E73_01570 [Candidatus Beckwithbacteria bacterium RIFCSPHIGHO2_12_FULL_47_17]OGD61823.1 MAG: hypothetical protein A3I57_03555 [Candidatus Beckwithbacteria bacterium RIFCSPLOWO2_02_FULL_47_23]
MENRQNKILLDCRFWGPSHTGLGRYTQELVTAMQKLKPRFELVFLTAKMTKIKPYSFSEQRDLSGLIQSFKPDLTHFLHFNVPLNFPGPFVVTIHDLIKHHSRGLATTTHWPGTYWLKRLGYQLVMKKAVNASQKILVPSSWVKQDLIDHFETAKEKIVITPEAANATYFKTDKAGAKLLPYDYFIYVGNAYPHKNIDQLIKAVKIVAAQNHKVKLVIVTGRDWFYRRLRLLITKLKAQPVVKLKDFTSDEDLRRLYQNSVAFVTASLYEGFGLPGLEAMAAGTLVLASRRAALPETYNGAAWFFDPDNSDELVNQMKQALVLDPAKRQQQLQRAQAFCRSYSWKKTAQKTLEVYESCLGLRSSQ